MADLRKRATEDPFRSLDSEQVESYRQRVRVIFLHYLELFGEFRSLNPYVARTLRDRSLRFSTPSGRGIFHPESILFDCPTLIIHSYNQFIRVSLNREVPDLGNLGNLRFEVSQGAKKTNLSFLKYFLF